MQKNSKISDNRGLMLSIFVVGLAATLFVVPSLFNKSEAGTSGKGLMTITSTQDPNLENYDIRNDKAAYEIRNQFRQASGKDASSLADVRDGFVRGEDELRRDIPTLKVEYSTDMKVPQVISPDVWKKDIARMTAPSEEKRSEILRNFVKQNSSLIGIDNSQADSLIVAADYTNPNGYMSFARLEQHINGIPVYRSEVRAGFTKQGEMIRVLNELTPGLDYGSLSTEFGDPVNAVTKAFGYINSEPTRLDVARNDKESTDMKVVFGNGDNATTAEKMYFPTEVGVARPAWRVLMWQPVTAYYVIVDAETGTMLSRENIGADQTQSATYSVFTNPSAYMNSAESPAPLTPYPGADPTTGVQGVNIARSSVTRIGNEAPNPGQNNLGWITDGTNITDGNNVEAGLDLATPDGVDAPLTGDGACPGAGCRTFTSAAWNPPPGNPAPGDAPTTADARRGAVTQMFYVMNLYHDELYSLGFTEAARNFQNDNFGRGGVGNDRVRAEGQDSSGTNNANFQTPADGTRGRMQMYVWTGPTPDYDGTTDADIIIHEVTHGTSTRLHNGLGNQGSMMGEGWSDWYAQTLLAQPSDPINGAYSMGGYALYQVAGLTTFNANYYYGIRKWPKAVIGFTGGPARAGCGNAPCPHNPLSFRHINSNCFTELGNSTTANISAYPMTGAQSVVISGTCSQVHNAGEIWSSALWEVRALMVTRLGFAAGTKRVLQVVTDGMKLAPGNPMMLQERDAIIAAASALPVAPEASADVVDVREGFRRRGMGFSASTQSATAVTEAFDQPNVAAVAPTTVTDAVGDNDGFPEPGENVTITVSVRNNTGAAISGVQVNINGGTNVNVGTVNDGQTVQVPVPYTVPAAAPCGSLHSVQINVSSSVGAQTPTTFEFRLGVPVGGAPVTVTNSASIGLPDGTSTTPAPASVYPSNVNVSGVTFGNAKVKMTFNGYTHTFPGDNDFLLVGPGGQKFIPQSDQGSTGDLTNVTYSLEDAAATAIPATQIVAGTFRPTADTSADIFPAPAPAAPYNIPATGGSATFGSTFGTTGSALNGTWSLYVVDDAGGDTGAINGGWTLTVEGQDYACSVGPPTAAEESRADFDGDGRSDLSVYRPSNGGWYLNRSTAGFTGITWGLENDVLVPGDYDGDDKTDTAVFRASNTAGAADFYILNSNGFTLAGYEWGSVGDIPVVGDYDNDNKDDVAIYRPSTGTWYIIKSTGGVTVTTYGGQAGDVPMVADWDGDGKADLSYRRGTVFNATLSNGGTVSVDFGASTDMIVPADYDGDDKDDIAVWRPSDGTWRVRRSSNSTTTTFAFGLSGDIPVPGDYDGDGTDDYAVYRNGTWYVQRSTGGFFAAPFGLSTDKPVAKAYIP